MKTISFESEGRLVALVQRTPDPAGRADIDRDRFTVSEAIALRDNLNICIEEARREDLEKKAVEVEDMRSRRAAMAANLASLDDQIANTDRELAGQ